jgi:small-conductance mechanosensitive channel
VGDQVQLNTPKGLATGTIQALTLGYTVLISSAGEQIIVPNSVMAGVVLIKPALKGDGQVSADRERRP